MVPREDICWLDSARQITIAQIIESIEGPLGITDCSHEKDGEFCMQRNIAISARRY